MSYIGNIPVPQATQTRDRFTATSGQTTFATSGYTPGFLDVYLNGVHLDASDYTATNGSDVVLDTGAATDDIVEVVAFTAFETASLSDGSVTTAKIADGAVTAAKIDSGVSLGGPAVGTDSVIRYNAQTIAEDITVPASSNGFSAGPITINSGYTVTVTSGSYWTVI